MVQPASTPWPADAGADLVGHVTQTWHATCTADARLLRQQMPADQSGAPGSSEALLSSLRAGNAWGGGCVLVAQSCPTLCDPMDCSLPSFSVHGIFQAIVLEWRMTKCIAVLKKCKAMINSKNNENILGDEGGGD